MLFNDQPSLRAPNRLAANGIAKKGECGFGATPLLRSSIEIDMARYYFHVKNGAELIKDQEGSEHATADEARLQALKSARELWADAIKAGKSLGADAIVIADEHGQLTFIPMADALPKRSQ